MHKYDCRLAYYWLHSTRSFQKFFSIFVRSLSSIILINNPVIFLYGSQCNYNLTMGSIISENKIKYSKNVGASALKWKIQLGFIEETMASSVSLRISTLQERRRLDISLPDVKELGAMRRNHSWEVAPVLFFQHVDMWVVR